jgi:hypothetical protein
MSENDPPTTPSTSEPAATEVSGPGPGPGTRWSRFRGAAASRRPQGRAGTILVGVAGFVLGLVVAGIVVLATVGGGPGGHGGHGPGRVAAQGPDGGPGGDGPGRGGAHGSPGRGGPDGAQGRGAAGSGGPVIQVQPGGTVIVQPGATVQQQATPAAPAPAAPAPAPAPTG